MAAGDSARVQEAQKLAKSDPRKAEAIYKEITTKAPSATSDAATREYESALISLGELYRDEKCASPFSMPTAETSIPLTSFVLTGRPKSW